MTFIAFEGGEGVGKSTQIGLLAQTLRAAGHTVRTTFEPGDTPLGAQLRRLLLDPSAPAVSPRAEALLYAADRAHHVDSVLRPALAAGEIVITDRYVDSTLAYQGVGRSLDGARQVTEWAAGGLVPDLTVVLDLDPEVGLARARSRSSPDRLEATSLDFHRAVRQAFLDLAAADPSRYLVLDAAARVDELAASIAAAVGRLL
jgi:dTMP kinase